ncbi:AraC family transcriptional regulator [Leptothrix sp. BB-4]
MSDDIRADFSHDIRVIERAPARLLAMRHIGPYGEGVGRFWQETFRPWLIASGLAGRPMVGIGRSDPSTTPPEDCRYDAAVEVDADTPVPAGDGVFAFTLPGGLHLVQRFEADPSSIGEAWSTMFSRTLPASGLTIAGSPFEYMGKDSTYDPQTGRFSFELCVPVRRPG